MTVVAILKTLYQDRTASCIMIIEILQFYNCLSTIFFFLAKWIWYIFESYMILKISKFSKLFQKIIQPMTKHKIIVIMYLKKIWVTFNNIFRCGANSDFHMMWFTCSEHAEVIIQIWWKIYQFSILVTFHINVAHQKNVTVWITLTKYTLTYHQT